MFYSLITVYVFLMLFAGFSFYKIIKFGLKNGHDFTLGDLFLGFISVVTPLNMAVIAFVLIDSDCRKIVFPCLKNRSCCLNPTIIKGDKN